MIKKLLQRLKKWCVDRCVSDERFIVSLYRKRFGKRPNLTNTVTFTEKLQWLKLNWRPDILTRCADKWEVRGFVSERVDLGILKELYGLYDRPEDIDFDKLPDAFVLKVTHGWNRNIFCKNKSEFDRDGSIRLLKRDMKERHFYRHREWAYRNIVPRIICEEYLTKNGETMHEYQFYCFDGVPRIVQILDNTAREQNMFDLELNRLDVKSFLPSLSVSIAKPALFGKMLEYTAVLSKGFPFVRVDLGYVNNRVYFSELTFYPNGGMRPFDPESFDFFLGSYLQLPAGIKRK